MGLTTSIGVFLSAGKKKKMQVFGEFYEFNEQLALTLKFSRLSLSKVAAPYKYVTSALGGNKLLKGEDQKVIDDYLESLGKTDASSQIDYVNERRAVLKKYSEESGTEYKKYSSLYVKIFFMIGILLAVLMA